MIFKIDHLATTESVKEIEKQIQKTQLKTNLVKTQEGTYIVGIGKQYPDMRVFKSMKQIEDIFYVDEAYQLVSRKWKLNHSVIDLGDNVKIGNGQFSMMAGPCSIESEENIIETVEHLKKNNIRIMRGGVHKPRTSPYSFRGMGMEGLKLFYKHCNANGIKIITEVMEVSQIEEMIDYVDIFQVGARNAQNFNLLDALGKVNKPVMIKRGVSGTIDELLQSAEYIFANGNEQLLLCERGIRTYEKAYRNTFDINAISILKEKSHLPVIADPSHGIGLRDHVSNIALSAILAGADGIIIETHKQPEEALSDSQQTLSFRAAENLYKEARQIFEFNQARSRN